MALPGAARSIGVDLNAETIRVREVQRLAHQVVGHADTYRRRRDACGELPECGAFGRGRQVKQAERTLRRRHDALPCLQQQQGPPLAVRPQHCALRLDDEWFQADDPFAGRERTRQITDSKHAPFQRVCCLVKTVCGRAVLRRQIASPWSSPAGAVPHPLRISVRGIHLAIRPTATHPHEQEPAPSPSGI